MVLIWILCVLSVAFCVYVDRLVNKRKWDLLAKIPGPTPWPIVGNANDVFRMKPNPINQLTRFFQHREGQTLLHSKAKMSIMWLGRQPMVFLSAPETVEPILSSNTTIKKGFLYKYMSRWLGEGLVMSTGDKWRTHRKLLTPSFHFRILDNFMTVMNEQADVLIKKVKEGSQQADWIDSFSYYCKCTMDIISETAMGIRIQAQEKDSTFTKMVLNVSLGITLRTCKPWLASDFIYFNTRDGKEFLESVKYLHNMTDQVISEKMALAKENPVPSKKDEQDTDASEPQAKKHLAFLDLLLESGLTKQELREQVDTFIFAGHDTTSTALNWMTYMIGLHKDVQEKLLSEVDSIFAGDRGRPVTKEDLRQLIYMDKVIKECQRIYPSVPGISRSLDKDTLIGEYMVPEGTECFLSIYSVHRDPIHYPNPEVFDPERFSPENSAGRHPYAFIPFSAGPRNCIGQRFALMELKIIMCHVLRHFRIISLDQRDKILLVPEIVLRTDRPIRTKFISR